MNHDTIAIIQARLGSSRLPEKVLADFVGQPLLQRVVERVRSASQIDRVVVATTVAAQDDAVQALCQQIDVPCFRGSEEDVLGRFADAIDEHGGRWIVRVNADNPFLAPEYLDDLVTACRSSNYDYASYRVGERPAMLTPCGFFAEVFSKECLDRANKEILSTHLREHVTLGIYQSPEDYKVHFLSAPPFAADARLRLTLDTPEDLSLLRDIASASKQSEGHLSAEQLYELIETKQEWLEVMQRTNQAQPK